MEEKTNTRYQELKSSIDSLIKSCHQILYNSGAIVGKKAMDDIMKIFTLKILQPLFNDENSVITQKWNQYKCEKNPSDRHVNRYKYCKKISKLLESDDPLNEWKMLVNNILSQILPNLFDVKDGTFHCDENALFELIKKIDNLDDIFWKQNNDVQLYDTISGDIYEYFINGYQKSGGKELGQFFTPRKLITLILFGLDVISHNVENLDIYDPCMGSGGFLTRAFNEMKIDPDNIFGNEIEKDTIKFGFSNLLLNTGEYSNNIKCQDSLINIDSKKHKLILTNPPFGTKMKYKKDKNTPKGLKERYEAIEAEKLKENANYKTVLFNKIFPIKTNNGACLFTQLCIYKLEDKAMCCIVLPDGQLFFGKNFIKFRKWLCETVRIQKIVKIPSGAFEHTGIKTCVVQFTKGKPTKNINFWETDAGCDELKRIIKIDKKDLKENNYSFDPKDYQENEHIAKLKEESKCKWMSVKEIVKINLGKRITKKDSGTKYPSYGAGKSDYFTDNFNREGPICKIARFAVRPPNCVMIINDYRCWVTDSSITVTSLNKNVLLDEYLWYYLLLNKNLILEMREGSQQPGLKLGLFNKFQIPVPSLEIQQKIIKELDFIKSQKNKIKDLINSTKEEIKIYKKYGLEPEIQRELKDCEFKKLGENCEFDKKSKRKASYGKNEGQYNFYKCSPKIMKCDKVDYKEERILIADGGNNIIYMDSKFSCSSHMHIITSKDRNIITNECIYTFIKGNIHTNILEKRGNSIENISKSSVKEILIPIPKNLEHQKKLINIYKKKEERLQNYENELNHLKSRIKDLNELGKSIIDANI